jgi:hypothetical protein
MIRVNYPALSWRGAGKAVAEMEIRIAHATCRNAAGSQERNFWVSYMWAAPSADLLTQLHACALPPSR